MSLPLDRCRYEGCHEPILGGDEIVVLDFKAVAEWHGAMFHRDCYEFWAEWYYQLPERTASEIVAEMLEHGITPQFELL